MIQTNDDNNINADNSLIIDTNNLVKFVNKSKSDQLAIENESYFKNRFGFVVSEEKRKILIRIFNDWQLTSQELKILYLNRFVSFNDYNDVDIRRFPFLFWVNSIFMLAGLIIFSALLSLPLIANGVGLLNSFCMFGLGLFISLILCDLMKSVINPINIISRKYYFTTDR